jgi:hypothetical protein
MPKKTTKTKKTTFSVNMPVRFAVKTKKHPTPLTARQQELASKYIAEEIATGAYSRAQAIAIGINRARKATGKKR